MKNNLKSYKWSFNITIITFFLAAIFSVISTLLLADIGLVISFLIVLIIIMMGIFFDMLGIAATSGEEKPFHAMASNKIKGAKQAIRIIRNADKFANFTNDVVGDINNIISGSISAVIIFKLVELVKMNKTTEFIVTVILTSLVAALTVGGKSLGKTYSIQNANKIIIKIGIFFYYLEKLFGFVLFKEERYINSKKRGGKDVIRKD